MFTSSNSGDHLVHPMFPWKVHPKIIPGWKATTPRRQGCTVTSYHSTKRCGILDPKKVRRFKHIDPKYVYIYISYIYIYIISYVYTYIYIYIRHVYIYIYIHTILHIIGVNQCSMVVFENRGSYSIYHCINSFNCHVPN